MKKKNSMQLKPFDQERLDNLYRDLELLNIRFPVAVLGVRMNTNRGNLSAYLNGKKPISDQFIKKFNEVFKPDLEAAKKRLQEAENTETEAKRIEMPGQEGALQSDVNSLPVESTVQEMSVDSLRKALEGMNANIQRQTDHIALLTRAFLALSPTIPLT